MVTHSEPKQIAFNGGTEITLFSENPDISLFESTVQPGGGFPVSHYHEHFDAVIYGKKGTITVFFNGKPTLLQQGESLSVPRYTAFRFENRGSQPARFLTEVRPGGLGHSYFQKLAEAMNRHRFPDLDELKSIMRGHGVVPVVGLRNRLVSRLARNVRKMLR